MLQTTQCLSLCSREVIAGEFPLPSRNHSEPLAPQPETLGADPWESSCVRQAAQLLLELGIEVDDALEMPEQTEV
jgi:hypothetical protein